MSISRTMTDAELRRIIKEMPQSVTVHYSERDSGYQAPITHYSFGPNQIAAGHLAEELEAVLDELAELRAKMKARRLDTLHEMTVVLRREIERGGA